MSLSPWALALDSERWAAFGSLTFRAERNAPRGVRLFQKILRVTADKLNLDEDGFRSLLWVVRKEIGEIWGRRHLHFLIGGVPRIHGQDFFCVHGCFWFIHEWFCLSRGGWARVRPFAMLKEESASEYIAKGGANAYEVDKFDDLIASASFLKKYRLSIHQAPLVED